MRAMRPTVDVFVRVFVLSLLGTMGMAGCSDDSGSGTSEPICGNGVLEPGEACDGEAFGGATCETYGLFGDGLACTDDCQVDLSVCSGCGNGYLDEGEVCDGANLGGKTCLSEAGLALGSLACAEDCQGFDTSGCFECGNGTKEGPEACDGDVSCEELGFGGGTARCVPGCMSADTKHCWACGDSVCAHEDGETVSNCPQDCGFVSLSVGVMTVCGLRADGTVWCWGFNDRSQLGEGTTQDASVPVPVFGLDHVKSVSAGVDSACAVTDSGGLWCWGSYCNLFGNPELRSIVPVELTGQGPVSQVAMGRGGSHCVLLADETVRCWGFNHAGQLGDGTTQENCEMVEVQGLTGVSSLGVGASHACAVVADGTVWCWGDNGAGQLGDGTTQESHVPVQVVDLDDVVQVGAGSGFTCALDRAGRVWCWGENRYRTLGSDGIPNSSVPIQVVGLGTISALAVGNMHVCVMDSVGRVWCWGTNESGQVGNGVSEEWSLPVQAGNLESQHWISTGTAMSCSLDDQGQAWCWGVNTRGCLGSGVVSQFEASPVQVADPWL